MWLRYFVEYESTSESARWYRGAVTEELATAVTPETAVAILESLSEYFAGGSYFGSTGFKRLGPLQVDL